MMTCVYIFIHKNVTEVVVILLYSSFKSCKLVNKLWRQKIIFIKKSAKYLLFLNYTKTLLLSRLLDFYLQDQVD